MKLYIDGQVYLQSFDLAYIFVEHKAIPDYILEEIKDQLPQGATRIDLTNEFEFGWVFKTIGSIDWIMDCEYIVNFENVQCETISYLDKLKADAYKAWTVLENHPNSARLLADEKIPLTPRDFYEIAYSLQAMIDYKIGDIKFPNLPNSQESKIDCYSNNRNWSEKGDYDFNDYYNDEEDYYNDEEDYDEDNEEYYERNRYILPVKKTRRRLEFRKYSKL